MTTLYVHRESHKPVEVEVPSGPLCEVQTVRILHLDGQLKGLVTREPVAHLRQYRTKGRSSFRKFN